VSKYGNRTSWYVPDLPEQKQVCYFVCNQRFFVVRCDIEVSDWGPSGADTPKHCHLGAMLMTDSDISATNPSSRNKMFAQSRAVPPLAASITLKRFAGEKQVFVTFHFPRDVRWKLLGISELIIWLTKSSNPDFSCCFQILLVVRNKIESGRGRSWRVSSAVKLNCSGHKMKMISKC
jgi:hypothetical protein